MTSTRIVLALASALSLVTSVAMAQQDTTWAEWKWLVGEWVGEGSGIPGQGGGWFSLQPNLENHVLVREGVADYPASGTKPAIHHTDLMIIYPGGSGQRAIYFDNEGHVIEYTASASRGSVAFISAKVPGVPVFRLVYLFLDAERIRVTFAMSRDGETFATYTEGTCTRRK
jgi:hypothetical protein